LLTPDLIFLYIRIFSLSRAIYNWLEFHAGCLQFTV
jgi:hypothetical protein